MEYGAGTQGGVPFYSDASIPGCYMLRLYSCVLAIALISSFCSVSAQVTNCVATALPDTPSSGHAFLSDTPDSYQSNSDLEEYVKHRYFAGEPERQMASSCGKGEDFNNFVAEMRAANPSVNYTVVPWADVTRFKSQKSRPSADAKAAKAQSNCLDATREGMYMRLSNKCDQRIEVAFCYKSPSEHFSCSRQQFGQQGIDARDSAGVSLPDTDEPGTISMVGCISPSTPTSVHYDGKRIRSGCG